MENVSYVEEESEDDYEEKTTCKLCGNLLGECDCYDRDE
jgi:hypothetical protein